jgi:hypothetical protein
VLALDHARILPWTATWSLVLHELRAAFLVSASVISGTNVLAAMTLKLGSEPLI